MHGWRSRPTSVKDKIMECVYSLTILFTWSGSKWGNEVCEIHAKGRTWGKFLHFTIKPLFFGSGLVWSKFHQCDLTKLVCDLTKNREVYMPRLNRRTSPRHIKVGRLVRVHTEQQPELRRRSWSLTEIGRVALMEFGINCTKSQRSSWLVKCCEEMPLGLGILHKNYCGLNIYV